MIFSLPKVDKWGPLAKHTAPQNRLGELYCDNDTNKLWVYVRANEAITRGAALQSVAPVTGANDADGLQAAAAGSNVIELASDTTDANTFTELLTRVPQQPRNSDYAMIRIGAQTGIIRSFTARSANVEWMSGAEPPNWGLRTAIAEANSNTINLLRPWLVEETDGNNQSCIGFAQRAIAVGEYFWALVEGIGEGLAGAAAVAADVALRCAANGTLVIFDADGNPNDVAVAWSYGGAASGDFPIIASAPTKLGVVPLRRTSRSEISYDYPSAT